MPQKVLCSVCFQPFTPIVPWQNTTRIGGRWHGFYAILAHPPCLGTHSALSAEPDEPEDRQLRAAAKRPRPGEKLT